MATAYKIGEAAALLNLKTYVLRFWETEFPHIAPLRTDKGQRLYTEDNLALLERIRFLLHERGLTIEGARKVLNEDREKGVTYVFAAGADKAGVKREPEAGAEPVANRGVPDEENGDSGNDVNSALSAAGKAVTTFLSQYNLPGIAKTYPIHEKSLSERPDYLHKTEPSSVRPHERPAGATDDAVFSGNAPAVGRPFPSSRSQNASRAWLSALTAELESIAGLLRGGNA